MSESDTVRNVRLALSNGDARLFRNNVGTAWRGRVVKQSRTMLLIENPQIVNFGLCTGSSDLIGWRSMLITPEMVGQRVAVFTALEGKAGRRIMTPEQRAFIEIVKDYGGLAGEFRSVDQVREIVEKRR